MTTEHFDDDYIHTTPSGRHFRHGDGQEVDGEGNPVKYTASLMSNVHRLTHERNWFILTDHPDANIYDPISCWFPPCNGDASLKACETWLANRGFKRQGSLPPEIFEYSQE